MKKYNEILTENELQEIINLAYGCKSDTKQPYKFFAGSWEYIVAKDTSQMVVCLFDFSEINATKILKKLNGDENHCINKDTKFIVDEDSIVITLPDGKKYPHKIILRGWGFLTGRLKLTYEQAKQVQDKFIEHLCNVLNS